jgi:hypothetical protein
MQDQVERLLKAIEEDESLRRAMAAAGDFDAQLRVAAAHGYPIALGDEQLDAVVGGKGGGRATPPPDIDAIHQYLQDLLANMQQHRPDGPMPPDPFNGRGGPIAR